MILMFMPFLMALENDELLHSLLFGKKKAFEEGRSYLLKEKKTEACLEYFISLIEKGYKGLYVTRQHPDHVNKRRRGSDMKIIWLSTTLGKDYVDPHNLGSLTNIIHSFVNENEKTIILMDGLEYLMINNDYPRILKFIEYINEIIMQRKSILLISIDDRAFDPRELALLERNVVVMN